MTPKWGFMLVFVLSCNDARLTTGQLDGTIAQRTDETFRAVHDGDGLGKVTSDTAGQGDGAAIDALAPAPTKCGIALGCSAPVCSEPGLCLQPKCVSTPSVGFAFTPPDTVGPTVFQRSGKDVALFALHEGAQSWTMAAELGSNVTTTAYVKGIRNSDVVADGPESQFIVIRSCPGNVASKPFDPAEPTEYCPQSLMRISPSGFQFAAALPDGPNLGSVALIHRAGGGLISVQRGSGDQVLATMVSTVGAATTFAIKVPTTGAAQKYMWAQQVVATTEGFLTGYYAFPDKDGPSPPVQVVRYDHSASVLGTEALAPGGYLETLESLSLPIGAILVTASKLPKWMPTSLAHDITREFTLHRLTPEGKLSMSKPFKGAPAAMAPYGITPAPDGGFFAIVTWAYGFSSPVYLARLSPSLELQWLKLAIRGTLSGDRASTDMTGQPEFVALQGDKFKPVSAFVGGLWPMSNGRLGLSSTLSSQSNSRVETAKTLAFLQTFDHNGNLLCGFPP